jgi:hypothetical protein
MLDPAILLLRLAARMSVRMRGAEGGGAAFDDWCGSGKEDGRIKSGHDVERTVRPAKAFAADRLILMPMGQVRP